MYKPDTNGRWLRQELEMLRSLLRSIPRSVTILFVCAVVAMNYLARFTLVSLPLIAITGGILVSWVVFLIMDVVVKHFGSSAANLLSILAIAVNLVCTILYSLVGRFANHPELDALIGGQWSVLLASTIAYVVSVLANSSINVGIGRKIRLDPNGAAAFAVRSFGSTLLSQITDNFLFVFLAFVVFPLIPGALQVRWTVVQCLGSSVAGALLELATEMAFSPIGYRLLRSWQEREVGREYRLRYGVAEG